MACGGSEGRKSTILRGKSKSGVKWWDSRTVYKGYPHHKPHGLTQRRAITFSHYSPHAAHAHSPLTILLLYLPRWMMLHIGAKEGGRRIKDSRNKTAGRPNILLPTLSYILIPVWIYVRRDLKRGAPDIWGADKGKDAWGMYIHDQICVLWKGSIKFPWKGCSLTTLKCPLPNNYILNYSLSDLLSRSILKNYIYLVTYDTYYLRHWSFFGTNSGEDVSPPTIV